MHGMRITNFLFPLVMNIVMYHWELKNASLNEKMGTGQHWTGSIPRVVRVSNMHASAANSIKAREL
jgi:hypothetical protein